MSNKWSRGDVIGCASLIVAVATIGLAIVTPEIRCWFQLDPFEMCSSSGDKDNIQPPNPYPANAESHDFHELEPSVPNPGSPPDSTETPPPLLLLALLPLQMEMQSLFLPLPLVWLPLQAKATFIHHHHHLCPVKLHNSSTLDAVSLLPLRVCYRLVVR